MTAGSGRSRGGTAEAGRLRRRRLGPHPGALLLGRLALPGGPAGGRPAARRGRAGRDPRRRGGHRRTDHHARRRHLDRRQRRRPRHRRRHRQAPHPGRLDRPRGAYGGRPARRRARQPAARGGSARPPLRAGPLDAHPLHDRRDDRQQRLRVAGARLRPHGRQRGGAGRRVGAGRHRCRGAARRAGGPAPRARAHRVRPVRSSGERLLARAPAARAPERRPVPGRLGGHPRAGPAGDGAAGRGHRRAAPGRARLPVDDRGRGCGAGPARGHGRRDGRLRRAGRPDRRPGPRQGECRA